MPIGFSFRPKEVQGASEYARRVLKCLECGQVVKKSTTNNEKNRGFVGCRNNRLLAMAASSSRKSATTPVHFIASYYSRLAENFDLAGPHIGETAFNRQRFKTRDEQNGLNSLIYQSLCTTIQAHFKISRTKMVQKYGWKPGGYPIPDEERPLQFQLHYNHGKFQPWPCVRRGGCVCAPEYKGEKNNEETTDDTSAVPEALEGWILQIIQADGNNRRFKTLENSLQQKSAFFQQEKPDLLVILKHLQKEGKVAMNLEATPKRPNTSLTNLGRRRLVHLKQLRRSSSKKENGNTSPGLFQRRHKGPR